MDSDNSKLADALIRAHGAFLAGLAAFLDSEQLTMNEFGTLAVLLLEGTQPVQQIAAKIRVTSGTATYVLDKLEQRRLVLREKSPQDKRSFLVRLTPEGLAFVQRVMLLYEAQLERLMADVKPQAKTKLINRLTTLEERISQAMR
jgi:MarR family 2-MHQ and catechol resistance regulon transcriptional repressor